MSDQKTQLIQMLHSFLEGFNMARAIDAKLAGVEVSAKLLPEYYAIIYGATDSFAQSMGAELAFGMQALRSYFGAFSDGKTTLDKVLATARDPKLLPWISEGGQAVYVILTEQKDPLQALLPLAEKYRIATS